MGQANQRSNPVEAIHYPRVIHAEVPLYPPIAWAANWTGAVEIQVTVERGSVVSADVKSVVLGPTRDRLTDEGKQKRGLYLSDPALANVKLWQFQDEDSGTFTVTYVYRIEGDPTPESGNPTVELKLPNRVTITARPIELRALHANSR